MGWLGFVSSANNFSLFKGGYYPNPFAGKKKNHQTQTKNSRGNETALKLKVEEMG